MGFLRRLWSKLRHELPVLSESEIKRNLRPEKTLTMVGDVTPSGRR